VLVSALALMLHGSWCARGSSWVRGCRQRPCAWVA